MLFRSTDIKVQVVLDRWNFSLRCNFFFNYHNRNLGLCRVPFIGHSTKEALPRAALGEVLLSVTSWFTECRTLGTGKLLAKTCLSSVKYSAKVALGKGPSATVLQLTDASLCRGPRVGTRQRTLYRVSYVDTRQNIFLFLNFVHQTFCCMLLHYVDLHVLFVENYNRVFNQ